MRMAALPLPLPLPQRSRWSHLNRRCVCVYRCIIGVMHAGRRRPRQRSGGATSGRDPHRAGGATAASPPAHSLGSPPRPAPRRRCTRWPSSFRDMAGRCTGWRLCGTSAPAVHRGCGPADGVRKWHRALLLLVLLLVLLLLLRLMLLLRMVLRLVLWVQLVTPRRVAVGKIRKPMLVSPALRIVTWPSPRHIAPCSIPSHLCSWLPIVEA